MTEMIITKLLLMLALTATIFKYGNPVTGNLEAPLWIFLLFAIGFLRLFYLGFRERFRKDNRYE
jgi:hypothetical protein